MCALRCSSSLRAAASEPAADVGCVPGAAGGLGGLGGLDFGALGAGMGGAGGGQGVLGGMDGLGGLGGMGALGGLGGAASAEQMQAMMAQMQNPAFRNVMLQMVSQPGVLDAAMAANPQLRDAVNQNPQLRRGPPAARCLSVAGCPLLSGLPLGTVAGNSWESKDGTGGWSEAWRARRRSMLGNPELLRRSLDPANLQAMLQMQQAMSQLQSSGFTPGLGAAGQPGADAFQVLRPWPGVGGQGGGAPAGNPAGLGGAGLPGGADPTALLRALGLGGLGAPAPVGNPAEVYASQLEQLQARARLAPAPALGRPGLAADHLPAARRAWASRTATPAWRRCSKRGGT